LPGRRNIVITRNAGFAVDGTERAASLDDALAMCADAEKVMIIGGGQIYKEIMDRLDVIELTEVHAETDGDTYFPEIDPADWREASRERFEPETPDGPAFSFVTLERA